MTGIAKKGWEYLWARYRKELDGASNAMVHRPVEAYVEQVLPYGDFGVLG